MNKEYNDLKKSLDEFLSKKREKELGNDRGSLIRETAIEVAKVFKPILDALVMNSKMSKDEIKGIAEEIANKINIPEINIPEILLPEINIPKTQVDVRVPDINISDIVQKIKMPDEMSIKGWVQLMGVDLGHPLPVQLRDKDGKPVNLLENLTTLVSQGGGGGKHDYLTIKGFSQSAYSELTNADGRIRVSVETGGGGLTDAELRASSVPVAQVSGASWSTEATIIGTPTVTVSGSIASTGSYLINGDGTYRDTIPVQGTVAVSGITNSVGATILDGEGNMKATWIVSDITASTKTALIDSSGVQYSGSNPVPITGTVTANLGTIADVATQTTLSAINTKLVSGTDIGDVTINNAAGAAAVNIQDGGNAITIDGTVAVSGITNSVASSLIDSSGIQYSGSNPVPISGTVSVSGNVASTGSYLLNGDGTYRDTMPVSGTVVVSSITATTAVSPVDSSGVAYSGSNPLPITLVSGALTSTVVVGPTVSDGIDDGSAPIKTGGIARTTNPTAVSGGDTVSASFDTIGRQIIRPVQVRGLIVTAYTSLTNGTETTLLAGAASTYHDLVYIMGANSSDVAVLVDLRCGTAGSIVQTIQIPASGTAGVSLSVPIPMPEVAQAWTADMGDITGTTVYLTGLFSKES